MPYDQDYGFILSFRFHIPQNDMDIYEFEKTDREWLWFIAQNRRAHLGTKLKNKVSPEILKAEIIIGKVANDKTNPTITAYLNGLYGEVDSDDAVNDTIKRLLPNKLDDQFCFLTERAIRC